MTTLAELQQKVANGEIKMHHTSYVRLYVSRKSKPLVEEYKGKFGEGYVVLSPNWNSSRYSLKTYYVVKEVD